MTVLRKSSLDQRTQTRADACDISILLPGDFRLQSGERLTRPELRLRLHGDLSSPKIAVAGGISAGRAVADHAGDKGWWRDMVRCGGAIDLNRFCVIGFDFLPNEGEDARTITTADQALALVHALDAIEIERLDAFVGASYGAMTALAFAACHPGRLGRLCVISAADRPHPYATALRGVQRRVASLARRYGAASEGVSLARQLAMISYRTPAEFAERFEHAPGAAAGDPYDVCQYLIARGDAYQMSAQRFVTLSDSIDRHVVEPAAIVAPSLFVAATSDRLAPAEETERLAAQVARGTYFAFDSLYGHDAFLKEAATIGPVIKTFIEEPTP